MQLIVDKRGFRLLPLLALAVAAVVLLLLNGTADAGIVRGGFEIDANDDSGVTTNALYSGQINDDLGEGLEGDDWAQGASHDGIFEAVPLSDLTEDGAGAGSCQDGMDNGDADGGDLDDDECHAVSGDHETVSADCYDFHVDINPDADGSSAFICDGSSSSSFDGNGGDEVTQVEQTIVSPSGSTPDNSWPITSGNNAPKTDLSHGYFDFRLGDSPCDADTDNDDPFFIMGGHRGDAEGTGFWGFEFNQVPPAGLQDLIAQTDTTLVFKHDENGVIEDGRSSNETTFPPTGDDNDDGDDSDRGDLLVALTLTGGGIDPALTVFEFDEDAANAQYPLGRYVDLPISLTCPEGGPGAGTIHSIVSTNGALDTDGDGTFGDSQDDLHDIEGPPWGVPTCDPTDDDDGGNSCRLVVGNSTGAEVPKTSSACDDTPGPGGGGTKIQCHSLSQLTFAEAALDLTGLGIPLSCFNSMIFTSRSSQVLDGADLKDVGGAEVDICGSKSGVKYHDRNADGDRDTGEEGLGGWDIHLFNNDGVHEHFNTCDANDITGDDGTGDTDGNDVACDGQAVGYYQFLDLLPGTYTVCETLKTDWFQSAPDGTADCSGHDHSGSITPAPYGYEFEVEFGQNHTDNDFGNYQKATKSGRKFEDTQADGFTGDGVDDDSDPGLVGWTIFVYNDVDEDGDLSAGDTLEDSVNTGAGGAYSFTLDPGKYIVCEEEQGLAGTWTQSYPASGADCSADVNGDGVADIGYAIDLESQETDSGNDFGNYRDASKSGTKFLDRNGDGVWDPDGVDDTADNDDDEVGLANFEIHLFGTDGMGNDVHMHDTTDSDGVYSFDVTPGDYFVCESPQPTSGSGGYMQTFPSTVGGEIVDCDDAGGLFDELPHAAGDGGTSAAAGLGYHITLDSGEADTGNNFGNARGSLLIEKRAKDASVAGCSPAGPTEPTPTPVLGDENCPYFGGATFTITPNPLTGSGSLVITDNDSNDVFDTTDGLICIDGVILDDEYTFEETDSNDVNYAEDDSTPTFTPTSAEDCATRTTSDTADVTFFNVPLSAIQVQFYSLAGADITKASIVCTDQTADTTIVLDATTKDTEGDNAGEDGAADPAFDDTDEIFTGLLPGTYNCTVVIDP